jgi:hypothetical protein
LEEPLFLGAFFAPQKTGLSRQPQVARVPLRSIPPAEAWGTSPSYPLRESKPLRGFDFAEFRKAKLLGGLGGVWGEAPNSEKRF